MTEMFAYGAFKVDCCECPLVRSSINPSDAPHPIIDLYDDYLADKKGSDAGEVTKEEAKEAWEHAIEEYKSQDHNPPGERNLGVHKSNVEKAEKVKQELWDNA